MGDHDACAVTCLPCPTPTESLLSEGPMLSSTPASPFSTGGLTSGT